MSGDMKEIVKEKYGEAALRVLDGGCPWRIPTQAAIGVW